MKYGIVFASMFAAAAAFADVFDAATGRIAAKWKTDEGGATKSLRLCPPVGLVFLFR